MGEGIINIKQDQMMSRALGLYWHQYFLRNFVVPFVILKIFQFENRFHFVTLQLCLRPHGGGGGGCGAGGVINIKQDQMMSRALDLYRHQYFLCNFVVPFVILKIFQFENHFHFVTLQLCNFQFENMVHRAT